MKVLFFADDERDREMFKPIMANLQCQSVMDKTNYDVIALENPDVIVLAHEESRDLEHRIVNAGIPTLFVPHGMLMRDQSALWGNSKLGHHRLLFIQACRKLSKGDSPLRLLKAGWYRLKNDYKENGVLSKYSGFAKIAAYGEAMKDILIGYNVKPENIVITGNPRFDRYRGEPKSKDGYALLFTEYLVEFGLWSVKQRRQYIKDIYDAVSECGLELVVKIHLLEDERNYEELATDYAFKIYRDDKLFDLVNGCDVAITTMSTAGLEAMVAGKPLIIYNPYNNPTPYNYGTYFAHNIDELILAINKTSNGVIVEGAERFVYEQAYLQDGESANRITEIILEMAKC